MDFIDQVFQEDDIEQAVSSSLFDDSDSSSSDEDFELARQFLGRSGVRHLSEEYLDEIKNYTDDEFIRNFRMNRKTVLKLTEGYKNSDIYQNLTKRANSRAYSISEEKTILIFLWFAGRQNPSYRDVSKKFKISLGALFRIISDVSRYLNSIADEVIKWPNSDLQKQSKSHYLGKIKFRNVIGCLGNTSITVTRPLDNCIHYWGSDERFRFVLQGVCNEKNKFLDIIVGSAGTIEPSAVFKNSPLFKKLTETPKADSCLITSNSNYPSIINLVAPFFSQNAPLSTSQFNFNKKLIESCFDIDYTFILLKRRFRQLYYVKLRDPIRTMNFIRACCILHNIADEEDYTHFENEEWIHEILEPPADERKGTAMHLVGVKVENPVCDYSHELNGNSLS